MKVVTAYSHKGGTGKTTALMMLASAIDARRQSALLIDCDPHQSFKAYEVQSRRAEADLWSDRFNVKFMHYEATPLLHLEELLLLSDESGEYDYCLLNLAGIDHPFNRHVLQYAELTLMPFAPAALDLFELPGAVDVLRQLGQEGEIGDVRVVFNRIKPSMTIAQSRDIEYATNTFPVMNTQIRETDVIRDIVMRGLLSRTISATEKGVAGFRKQDVHRLKDALQNCIDLLDEVDVVIDAHAGGQSTEEHDKSEETAG